MLAVMLILVTAVVCTGCSAFQGTQTAELAPHAEMVVLIQLPAGQTYSPDLLAAIQQYNAEIHDADPQAPYLTAVALHSPLTVPGLGEVYALDLTAENLPATAVTIRTQPWMKYRTDTLFNANTLLPPEADYTAYMTYTFTKQPTTANTDLTPLLTDEGNYTYLWRGTDAITITNQGANPTLWYLTALAVAVAVGIIVYLLNRRKKRIV